MEKLLLLTSLCAIVLFAGCSDDDENTQEFSTVVINFSHTVDGAVLAFDDISYQNEMGSDYSVETLQYFISDVIFYNEDGEELMVGTDH